MFSTNLLPRRGRAAIGVAVAVIGQLALSLPAEAAGPQCQRRFISGNIQDAVLALKATQYCVGTQFPYTQDDVLARIESLRCGPDSENLIDALLQDYDSKYKLIMTTDPSKTVCLHAAQLDLNQIGKE